MGTTTKYGLRYPALTDAPNGPQAFQNLAEDVDGLGLVGGKRRTSTSASTSGSTELQIIDTGSLVLAASSVFQVFFFAQVQVTLPSGTDFDIVIRPTNLSGTSLVQGVLPRTQDAYPYTSSISVLYKTTAQETKTFVGSVVRTAGSATCTASIGTYMIVRRLGPSSLITDI